MAGDGSVKRRVARAEEMLRANISDPLLSPSQLARKLDVGLPAFSRVFKQVTGRTCTRYISAERIRVAKRLLRSDSARIKEIATKVGFRDPNYFARKFREIEGLSPSSYRRRHRNSR